MDADRSLPAYELKSSLARISLHATDVDPNRKLLWVNSICILFLLIGVSGSNPARIFIKSIKPVEQVIPAIVEPLPPPKQAPDEPKPQEETEPDKPDTPQVVVVTPDAPNITFAVPTIGNLVVPNAVAAAPPPLHPLQPVAPLRKAPSTLVTTGVGGERPQPPYPKIALELGQQGTVVLRLSVDESGQIVSIDVKDSSGSAVLDRTSMDFVRRHWKVVPSPGSGIRLFDAPIAYRIERR